MLQKVKVTGEGGELEYRIVFAHNRREGYTTCCIFLVGESGKPIPEWCSNGNAFCSIKDEWDDLRGKKGALENALDTAPFHASLRPAIWAEFLKRHGVKVRIKSAPAEEPLPFPAG